MVGVADDSSLTFGDNVFSVAVEGAFINIGNILDCAGGGHDFHNRTWRIKTRNHLVEICTLVFRVGINVVRLVDKVVCRL